QTEIIGLSAALPNADDLGGWLGAKVCRTTKRDIPLIEEIWTKSTVYSKEFGQGYDAIQERPNLASSIDTLDVVLDLIARKQTPIIVFFMTKPRAEALAKEHYTKIRSGSSIRKIFAEIRQLLLFFTEGGPTGRSLPKSWMRALRSTIATCPRTKDASLKTRYATAAAKCPTPRPRLGRASTFQ